MNDMDAIYSTKDIAEKLGVEAVTVRKYALALEKAGYPISRSDGKNRDFNNTDVMALLRLQSLRATNRMTLEEAVDHAFYVLVSGRFLRQQGRLFLFSNPFG